MRPLIIALWAAALLSTSAAFGQLLDGHAAPDHPNAVHAGRSPYAGMARRLVKTLSDRQMADLTAGRGMGLALGAELNGYPGPSHVLELADALQLSEEQRMRTTAVFDAMRIETIPLGEQFIVEETALERLFADKTVTPASLDRAVARIAEVQGALRVAHLRYHLVMFEIMSPAQIARYAELRGYTAAKVHGGHSD